MSTAQSHAKDPAVLYKFISARYAATVLASPYLWYTDWRKLDDLMEVMPGVRHLKENEIRRVAIRERKILAASSEKFRNITLAETEQKIRNMMAAVTEVSYERSLRAHFKRQPADLYVCSLTARWNSGTMWAQYGDRHRGIVIGLRFKSLESLVSRPAGKKNLSRVIYSNMRPQVAMRPITSSDNRAMRRAVVTKGKDWLYQNEWRIVNHTDLRDSLSWLDISEIIVGYRAKKSLRTLAEGLATGMTRIYQAHPSPGDHRMSRTQLPDSENRV